MAENRSRKSRSNNQQKRGGQNRNRSQSHRGSHGSPKGGGAGSNKDRQKRGKGRQGQRHRQRRSGGGSGERTQRSRKLQSNASQVEQPMKEGEHLKRILRRIDGKGYGSYKDIRGSYDFDEHVIIIDHVQGDPFAAPSRVRVRVPMKFAFFPSETSRSGSREIALRDFLTREFSDAIRKHSRGRRGSGKSGAISIDRPGQEMLERTSILITEDFVEARFFMGLPAVGRKVAGRDAEAMFFQELPPMVHDSLIFDNLDSKALYEHIEMAEDADFLRDRLEEMGLVAFVADGAMLPRMSGIDQRPLSESANDGNGAAGSPGKDGNGAAGSPGKDGNGTAGSPGKDTGGSEGIAAPVPFESPDAFRVEVDLPNSGVVTGMGIPEGVTLIVGGGYHGKSTLLDAIQLGVYNHIPGDGRELVVTRGDTVKIRAEDGRRIEKVDISPFINNLPFGGDTRGFSSEDASGSTSQAANIIEALESDAGALLIDEDTSATNFMIRDHRMQELVAREREPITPFIDRVHQLHEEHGVSTILVMGGSGDYFDVADRAICMVEYRPVDVTADMKAIAEKHRAERQPEGGESFGEIIERIPLSGSFDPSRGQRDVRITSRGLQKISFGVHDIDLGAVEQLVDASQTRAIGDAIQYSTRYMDGERTLWEITGQVMDDIRERGLDVIGPYPAGDYAIFREQELAAAINRLRTLKVSQRR